MNRNLWRTALFAKPRKNAHLFLEGIDMVEVDVRITQNMVQEPRLKQWMLYTEPVNHNPRVKLHEIPTGPGK